MLRRGTSYSGFVMRWADELGYRWSKDAQVYFKNSIYGQFETKSGSANYGAFPTRLSVKIDSSEGLELAHSCRFNWLNNLGRFLQRGPARIHPLRTLVRQ